MCIRPDLDRDAELPGAREEAPVEIQPLRVRVELHGHAERACLLQHGIHVDGVRITRQQETPRRVAEDGEMRVVERAEDALGHPGLVHGEPGMYRPDDEIEAGEQVFVVIERAVGKDVRLDALEDAEVGRDHVQRVDLRVLLEHALARHSTSVERRQRVIRDSDVAPAARARRRCHLGDSRLAVGVVGMAVQRAANVAWLEQHRHASSHRKQELRTVLPHLGRNEWQVDEPVDRLLGRHLQRDAARIAECVAVECHALARQQGEHGAHVLLGARGAPERDDEVPLGHAVRSVGERRGHGEGIAAACSDDIDVADSLTMPPERAGELRHHDIRASADGLNERSTLLHGARMERARARAAKDLDAAQQLRRGFRTEALQRGKPSVARGGFEGINGVDSECLVQQPNLRRRESGHAEQVDQAGWKAVAELLEVVRLTRLLEVADDAEDCLADARRARELTRPVEGAEVVGVQRRNGARRLLVRAGLEPAFAAQFEKGGDLGENAGGGAWIHPEK